MFWLKPLGLKPLARQQRIAIRLEVQKSLEPVELLYLSVTWDHRSNLIAVPCAVLARGLCALACAARSVSKPQVSQSVGVVVVVVVGGGVVVVVGGVVVVVGVVAVVVVVVVLVLVLLLLWLWL